MKLIMVLFLLIQTTGQVFAQANEEDLDALVDETKSDLLVVVGAGLAGAILGLSTLSFVDEPKEHTQNITMGASLGIIIGVGYVAFSQANKSKNLMYPAEEMSDEYVNGPEMDTQKRRSWHADSIGEFVSNQKVDALNYRFRF